MRNLANTAWVAINTVRLRGKGKKGKGLNPPLPLFPNHKGDAKYLSETYLGGDDTCLNKN
ncbi:hypothetical protein FDUTEX481_03695 [Tolypothrix sp. PCC 7601]|nr:hypothetical protein FDUTEX481_03695 [Tolypothrix sp. PCC 7601]